MAFAGRKAAKVHELCATVDWDRFIRSARFHRVQGLVSHSLWSTHADVPPQAALTLSTDAETIVATNLRISVEARDLRLDFEKAGLDLLFVKGLTTGALAYPKPFLKMGWDIDLLIAPEQLAQAAELLRSRGYRLVIPQRWADLMPWHGRRKESVWTRDPVLHVELHTRLADNRLLIPSIDVHSPRQLVEVASGVSLPTLARDELFAYLCVHGASSAWFRLKWITDLAALLHGQPADEIDRLYSRSQQLGAGRAAAQALLLAHRIYRTPAVKGLDRKAAHRWLAKAAWQQLQRDQEPTAKRFGTATIHLTQLFLAPGLGFPVRELARQLRDAAT